jgi:diguanylate cyclase (GGDEF)-like protein
MADQKENLKPKILLAGDIGSAFVTPDAAEALEARKCSKITDAVKLASEEDYALVGVVMSGTAVNLESALKSLRQANRESKIILLAQMYHEPLAMKFIQGDREGKRLADDYLICPVVAADFDKWLGPAVGAEPQAAQAIAQDALVVQKIRELEKLATEDDLTGLKNRRYIWEFGRQIIARAKKTSGRVTLLIFDIDDFKHYNDQYGHPAGDDILKQAAALIQRCCRRHDVVGRIGGDEFAVVFWDDPRRPADSIGSERRASSDHPKEAVFIAERFREQLETADFNLLGPGGKGVLTISGGLASFPRNGTTVEELFKKADEALLEAKKSGKNQIYLVGKPDAD